MNEHKNEKMYLTNTACRNMLVLQNLNCRQHPLKNCHEVTQRWRDLPSEQSGFKRCWTVDLWGFIVLFGHNYLTHANQTRDRAVPVKNMHDRHFVR